MDIGILGAGAMGQLFGARLQLAGNTVAFIDAAPATIAALNHGGITLTTGGRREHTAVRAGTAADFDEPFDLIIVFTKGFHTAAALESVRHLTGPRTHGLTLQNGLGNGEVLAGHFGPDRTWVGVTDFPADLERPGVLATSDDGKVRLGPFRAGPRSFARQLAELLSAAGLNADVPPDIQAAIWEKAAFNAALNSISAVTGQTVGAIGASSQGRELVRSILGETAAVAAAHGVRLGRERVEAALENAFTHHGSHKTSMLQDREAGRHTEIDFIGGAVVRLGQAAGVPTPVLWTLCSIIAQPLAWRPAGT